MHFLVIIVFHCVCLFHQMINLPIPLFESTQFAKRAAALEMSICSNVRHHRKAKVNQDYPSHWIWSFEGLLSITKEIGLEKTQKSWKFFCCIFFFLLLNFECMNDHLGSSWWSQALEGHKFWQQHLSSPLWTRGNNHNIHWHLSSTFS